MTALSQYERLEATGLWREHPGAQRREVIVSFGKASLVLTDHLNTPLTHWSMAAVRTLSRDDEATTFGLDRQDGETLEISDPDMIEAIGKVRTAIRQGGPRPGRLRVLLAGVFLIAAVLLAIFWLPDVATRYAARVIPAAKEQQIGKDILAHAKRFTGKGCTNADGQVALDALGRWLLPEGQTLHVTSLGGQRSTHLPAGHILLDRALIEEHAGPEVAAGYVLMELARSKAMPPMHALFNSVGTRDTLSFLATGGIREHALEKFAQMQLSDRAADPSLDEMLVLFTIAGVPSSPFAHAHDPGLTRLSRLVEEDPVQADYAPQLSDAQWIALQDICSEG